MNNLPAMPQNQRLATEEATLEVPPPLAAQLRTLTPARVGLRQAGVSIATTEVLAFQLAHGRARDAVHASLQPASLLPALHTLSLPRLEVPPLLLHSAASTRQNYLQRPDLGRRLDEASRQRLNAWVGDNGDPCNLAIAIADGLSALAVERHAVPLLTALFAQFAEQSSNLCIAPLCLVEQGRVAIGDEIAHLLHAALVVVLIGERPGLSSPDSLGAYITWNPQPGRTTDAERNCISNIRTEGLGYTQAAGRLAYYIHQAHRMKATGIALKDPESVQALTPGVSQ